MRIAVVNTDPPLPANNGGRIYVKHLLEGLHAQGHEILGVSGLIATPEPTAWRHVYIPVIGTGLSSFPRRARLKLERKVNPYAYERLGMFGRGIEKALQGFKPDVVVFNHTYGFWKLDWPSVLVCHNIESDRMAGVGAGSHKRILSFERQALAGAHAIGVFSETDAARAGQLVPGVRVSVVGLGVEPSGTRKVHHAPAAKRFLCSGSFDYGPNRDGALALIEAWRTQSRPGEELVVAGRAANSLPAWVFQEPGVQIYSDLPDLGPLMRDADALIVPLSWGGGIRVKILEAFAMGLPVLSTALGAEGIPVEDGRELLLIPNLEQLRGALDLVQPVERRERLATAGRSLYLSSYTPKKAVSDVLGLAEVALALEAERSGAGPSVWLGTRREGRRAPRHSSGSRVLSDRRSTPPG